MPKTITLSQKELRMYTRLGASTNRSEMEPEDAQACRQIGLFFAANPHLAGYAIDIERLILTPQGEQDTPPLAVVRINRKKRTYTLHSNEEGLMPDIPRKRSHRRRHRR